MSCFETQDRGFLYPADKRAATDKYVTIKKDKYSRSRVNIVKESLSDIVVSEVDPVFRKHRAHFYPLSRKVFFDFVVLSFQENLFTYLSLNHDFILTFLDLILVFIEKSISSKKHV